MDVLTRFGAGDQLYIFDTSKQASYRDNFRNGVPRTTRLPGVSGGYDELGIKEAPSEIGNVSVDIWLLADTPQQMFLAKKTIGRLKSFGTTILTKQPVGGGETMYCLAKLNNADWNEDARSTPYRHLRVSLDFQVTDPKWRAAGTTGGIWDDGTLWDDGTVWDGEDVSVAVSGVTTEFTITPDGNAVTFPTITFVCTTGQSASQLKIQRLVAGSVVDELSYSTTLVANDTLEINAETKTIKLNTVDAYGSAFNFKTAEWFRLFPGVDNAIRVKMGLAGDAGTISVNYEEMYI
jgi:hypothetical protein